MQAGAAVADLRAGHDRWAVVEAGGGRRSAGALRDILIHLAVLIRARSEALHRGGDHARVERLDVFPGEPHAVQRAGREILDQHVALFHQRFENLLAFRIFGIDGDRALVVVEHREIKAVYAGNVAQLAARDVSLAGPFDLDHVRAQPRQQLRAGRPRLHMREIEDLDAIQCLAHYVPLSNAVIGESATPTGMNIPPRSLCSLPPGELASPLGRPCGTGGRHGFFFAAGLRLVMRPLSVPAFSSMTALISVGLRERIASSIALRSSAGVVASTPTPPKASISFS